MLNPKYKLSIAGSIIDFKEGLEIEFNEKNVVSIVIQYGDKKIFYESNDEFIKNKKMLERLKILVKSEIQNGHKRIPTSILYNILEKK